MSFNKPERPTKTKRRASTSASLKPSTLAIAISGALLTGIASADEQPISLDKLNIEEEVAPDANPYAVPGVPYLSNTSADPRRTRPISETPATITIVTKETIKDSGRSDLREILDGQPGITLGTGENGNAFGDRYIIRGHEARSDMFVDGLRDPGMTIRESFAVEQLEITKGPSSTFAGRGATGGAVNAITKRASTETDFTMVSGGIGSDSHHRLTLDSNKALSDKTALRVNLLHGVEDVPDRDPADRERMGALISLTHEPSDKLQLSADYYHIDAEDKPDLGSYIPWSSSSFADTVFGDPVGNVPVYLQNEDFLESTVDTFTFRAGYAFNEDSKLINLTRYGTTDNGYVATGGRGGTVGYATEDDATNGANGFNTPTLSTHQGWQEVEYFANQLSFVTTRDWGWTSHDLIATLEYSDHKVLNGTYGYTVTGASNCYSSGRNGVGEAYCMYDADGNTATGINNLMQRQITKGDFDSDWSIKTTAVSLMDTVEVTDFVTVFGGVRYDYYDYSTLANFDPDGRAGPEPGALTKFEETDGFWNGHLGATYDITPELNIYASYSTATNINGGESDVGTSCGYGGICVDGSDVQLGNPEKTENIELGSKWLLADGRLLLSGALFQITKDDVMESPSGDSYSVLGSLNTGKNRVEGVELSLSGQLTDKLSMQAGIAVMDAEVLESITEDNIGKTLGNFAEESASVHVKYQMTPKFAFGGTYTYESERFTGQPDTAANEDMGIPEYATVDLFAAFNFSKNLRARVNVENATDENYYLAAYRSGAFTYIGDAQNISATLEYDF